MVRTLSSGPSRGLLVDCASWPGGLSETVPLPSAPLAADPSLSGGVVAAMLSVGRLARTLPCAARRRLAQAASPFCMLRPREPAAGCRAEAEAAAIGGSRPSSPFLPRYAAAPARLLPRAAALTAVTVAVGLGRTCEQAISDS